MSDPMGRQTAEVHGIKADSKDPNSDLESSDGWNWEASEFDRESHTPNVRISLISGDPGNRHSLHGPAIDLDLPARVVPSLTSGHCHLYIDRALTWGQYVALLDGFKAAGLIEHGFYKATMARGFSSLRLLEVDA